jgi:NOL1/NOP2/fmu family ribosome biogenesis protein
MNHQKRTLNKEAGEIGNGKRQPDFAPSKFSLRILKNSQRITHQLKEQFGIDPEIFKNARFIEAGKGKIRLFTAHLSEKELNTIQKNTQVQGLGIYAIRKEKDDSLRLTLDGTQLLKHEITKNKVHLEDKETEEWLQGHDIPRQETPGVKVILHNEDALGCARSNEEKLTNHIPKERRTKT